MTTETKTAVYDEQLRLEAYHFSGIAQPFPNHFHDYYVIGFVESGERRLSCKNQEYTLKPGDIVLFGPGDNHACTQSDGGTLDYRALNISQPVMLDLAEEVTGMQTLPGFSQTVVRDEEILCTLRSLHRMVMRGTPDFGKEEALLFLLSALIGNYGQPFSACTPACPQEIENACAFIRAHFSERLSLEQICRHAGLSKSTLLRAFTKAKGITPYRYLETIRISEAKALLQQGVPPIEAALRTGFSDQSHFTNYFGSFIGLAPGVYRDIFSEKEDGAHAE